LSKFKTIYFASIAHDLRSPINTVMNINETLGFNPQLTKDGKQLIKISNASCRFLLSTIDDVFDMSKIELN
jgi:signal transduction histidine kinase